MAERTEETPAAAAPAAAAPAPADAPAVAAPVPTATAESGVAAAEPAGPGVVPAQAAKAAERAEGEAPAEAPARPSPREAPPPARRPRTDRRFPRRKVCAFCADRAKVVIDYKDVGRLRRYISDRGMIEPRRRTGTCAKHQRRLSVALKRARHVALLPYTPAHVRNAQRGAAD